MAKQNIHEIEKFNPYHDARGRFTTGSGATSFTIRTKDPSKQHLADRAVQREKERAEAVKPKAKMEFNGMYVQQGEPMSHEEADGSNCNPNYYLSARYQSNCQSCVVAYEMRRRGYNVQAQQEDFDNNKTQDDLAKDTSIAWTEADGTPAQYDANGRKERNRWVNSRDGYNLTKKRFAQEIEDAIGSEGRYTIAYSPKGSRRTGHIVIAYRDSESGNVVVYDPQNGRHSTVSKLASETKVQGTLYGNKYNCHPQIMRIDNKEPVKEVVNAVLTPSR